MNEVLLKYRNLNVTFEMYGLRIRALREINFEVNRGEVLGIVGESGSGKSVLLQATLRLLPKNAKVDGDIFYKGLNLLSIDEREFRNILGKNFSLIPQGFASLNPCISNWIQISERPMEHFGILKNDGQKLAIDLLDKLGISNPIKVAKGYRSQLSGGMLQRVLVAMGISAPSEIIFVDEPTKGLDGKTKKLVINLLKISKEMTKSMVIVSHDLNFLREIADRICVLYWGDVLEICSNKVFFEHPRHPYSQALVNSLPSRGLIPIQGEPPSISSLPAGCSFHPRCPHSNSKCKQLRPKLIPVDDGMVRCFLYGE